MLTDWDRAARDIKQNEREIRRLRVQMDKIAAGGTIRSTAITTVLPPAAHPVEWWFNANLLGLGVELELLVGGGVWISGTFVGDRAYYEIGAYCEPPCGGAGGATGTVGWYANGGWFCDALEADLQEGSGVWLSGSCVAGRAVYHLGAYPVASGGLSGVSVALEGTDFCFAGGLDFHQGAGVWISGACVAGQADITVGAYPADAPPPSISGVDVLLNDGELCFAQAVDFQEGAGVWISGSCAAGEAALEFGAYPADAPPTSISGVDFHDDGEWLCHGRALDLIERPGVWISGSCAAGVASYEVGGYPAAAAPESISGVDLLLDGGPVCFARAIDFVQTPTVWISGSCAGDEGEFEFGAYPPDLSPYLTGVDLAPYISGVDFAVNGAPLCFGYGLDIQQAVGIWVSGSCAGDEAGYEIGLEQIDHGGLAGLADDDHPQYATNAEFDDHNARHEPGGADAMAVDAAAATGSLRTLGTAATAACAGNDARLSDARTPTPHKDSHDPNDGSDALDTAVPANIDGVQAAAVGTAHTLARADHAHRIQHSIADNAIATIDQADAADNDYAKFTANGLEGRSYAEVASDIASSLYSITDYVFVPDAAPGATILVGDQQGGLLHSGPSAETAFRLLVDAETAPGASGLPITVQYGDTNDLDTVASWTTIATYTLSSEKSNLQDSMTNASIPANRLIRMNIGTIVGTPKDATITLRVKRPLSA